MSAPTACPGSDVLGKLVRGQVPPDTSATIFQHLERCDDCFRSTLEKVTNINAETIQLRQLPEGASPSRGAQLAALISQCQPQDGQTKTDSRPSPDGGTKSGTPSYSFLAPPRAEGELGWLAHYRVTKLLGKGGMGMVFQAEDTDLRRTVALKVIQPEMARENDWRERFLREARAMAAIKNDHVVTIYQVGQDNGVPFFAMEFLQGLSLEDWLEKGQRVTLAHVLRIGRETALGLAAAHAHDLIHRDIKLANIWLEKLPETPGAPSARYRIKILDFGLARGHRVDHRLTQTGVVMGTPSYMAPELARGEEEIDSRCDIYSLGCVLYRLCTGKLPFDGPNVMAVLAAIGAGQFRPVRELNPEVPLALAELIEQMLSGDRAARPASARDVIEAIRAIERGERSAPELVHAPGQGSVPPTARIPTPAPATARTPRGATTAQARVSSPASTRPPAAPKETATPLPDEQETKARSGSTSLPREGSPKAVDKPATPNRRIKRRGRAQPGNRKWLAIAGATFVAGVVTVLVAWSLLGKGGREEQVPSAVAQTNPPPVLAPSAPPQPPPEEDRSTPVPIQPLPEKPLPPEQNPPPEKDRPPERVQTHSEKDPPPPKKKLAALRVLGQAPLSDPSAIRSAEHQFHAFVLKNGSWVAVNTANVRPPAAGQQLTSITPNVQARAYMDDRGAIGAYTPDGRTLFSISPEGPPGGGPGAPPKPPRFGGPPGPGGRRGPKGPPGPGGGPPPGKPPPGGEGNGPGSPVIDVILSPDGKRLAMVWPTLLHLWSLPTQPGSREIPLSIPAGLPPQFSPDGKLLVVASEDGMLHVWQTNQLHQTRQPQTIEVGGRPVAFRIAPDGQTVAVACDDGSVRPVHLSSQTVRRLSPVHQPGPISLDFSPDSRRLATCDSANVIRLWDVGGDDKQLAEVPSGQTAPQVLFHPKGKLLASISSADRTFKLWDIHPEDAGQK